MGSRFLTLALLLFVVACTSTGFAVVNLPTQFDDLHVVHDVTYGPESGQKLDIYRPNETDTKPHDVIVFFYGGRWTYGTKEDYRFVGAALSQRGFIVVIPDYRKYPQVRFPVFVEDGAKALGWVYDNISTYGGDPKRIHVAGHSAGAHIGALLTADAQYLKAEGKNRSHIIHDFVGLAGPYAFTPDEPDLEDMFGPPENYPKMQVPTFIDGHQPPMLLLYGDADKDVKPINFEKLRASIKAKGGCVQSIIYPGATHIGLVAGFSWMNPDNVSVIDDMMHFYNRTEQGGC